MAEYRTQKDTGLVEVRKNGKWEPFIDAESTLDSILINAGAAFHQLAAGAESILTPDSNRPRLAQEQRDRDALLGNLREARPVSSFVGDLLPGLATAPIGGTAAMAGKLGQSLMASVGLGALEGAFRLDPTRQDQTFSTLAGATGGFLGEGLGRMAGRVGNAITGLGRQLDRNPVTDRLAKRGLRSFPREQLNVNGQNIGPATRMEQGARASALSPGIFREIPEERALAQNRAVAKAMGLGQGADEIDELVLAEARDGLDAQFRNILGQLEGSGNGGNVFDVGDEVGAKLAKSTQIKRLIDEGEFRGLADGKLTAREVMTARQALMEDAAFEAAQGRGTLATKAFEKVSLLDEVVEQKIGPELLPDWKRAREQYNIYRIVSGPGALIDGGNVSSRKLAAKLKQDTGLGRVAREKRTAGLEPETADLLALTNDLGDRTLKPIPSSQTAENTALDRLAGSIGSAAGGDFAPLAATVAAPLGFNALAKSAKGADVIGGLLVDSPGILGRLGGEIGSGASPDILDLLLQQNVQDQRQQR